MSTPEEMEIYLINVFQLDDNALIIALFQQRLDTLAVKYVCMTQREPDFQTED
jgi:hypothetical protein